jgi:hypothetical protein
MVRVWPPNKKPPEDLLQRVANSSMNGMILNYLESADSENY